QLGFVVPLVLGELVHVWDIPALAGGSCKALRLRPDPAFKRRTLLANWCGMGALGLLIAAPFAWVKVHAALGIAALAAGVVSGVVAFVVSRENPRTRAIRLVLGPHTWGSSDPATWDADALEHVA